ncbi:MULTISPECIES: methyltransferase family protein [Sorangium]|uniref:methyltransferase family protein n=1 Tax=Sorangium TaxID=39643 RepID=UPI003D9C212E
MSRPLIALILFLVYFALAFGWRSLRQLRATGSTGFRGISGAPGSMEWTGGVLFVLALVLAAVAPLAELAGWVAPLVEPGAAVVGVGVATVLAGIAGTLWSQVAMGESWRIGVDAAERTRLVTRGPFTRVRNPIFSFMALTAAGMLLVVPDAIALASLLALVAAIELQVRFVEEPYLLRTHGDSYAEYCARVGRFVPGLGLLAR